MSNVYWPPLVIAWSMSLLAAAAFSNAMGESAGQAAERERWCSSVSEDVPTYKACLEKPPSPPEAETCSTKRDRAVTRCKNTVMKDCLADGEKVYDICTRNALDNLE